MENYFARNLVYLREKNKMKQEDLAKKIGVDRSTVGHWESGRRSPKMGIVLKIAEYFNIGEDIILKDLKHEDVVNQYSNSNIKEWEYLFYNSQNKEKLTQILKATENMNDEDINMVWNIIEAIAKKHYNRE